MVAVLTADLVESSQYDEKALGKVLDTLKNEFSLMEKSSLTGAVNFRIYRGDSFQGIIKRPENSLKIALQIRSAIKAIPQSFSAKEENYSKMADVKLAIGIGSVDFERESIAESNGQAFQFSGRTLDQMKYETRKTRLTTPSENINNEFNASLFLLDTLIDRWSKASAEVVYFLLKGLKEREIAEELNISQSAVNQRKKTAGWEPILILMQRFEEAISNTFVNE